MRKPFFFIFMSICFFSGFYTSISAQPVLKKIIGAEGRPGEIVNLTLEGENLLQVVRIEAVRFDDEELDALDYKIESDEIIRIQIRIPYGAQPGRHKILVLVADQKTQMWLEPNADSRDATIVQYEKPDVDILYDNNMVKKGDALNIDFVESPAGIFVSKTITLRNPRKLPLALNINDLPPELLLVGTLPEKIPPENEITFELQLSPEAPANFTQPFQFSINESPITLQINGTTIPIIPPEPQIPDGLEKLVIIFDSSNVWPQNGKSLVLRNNGADTLTLRQLQLPGGFISTNSLPVRIPPFDSVALRIQLDPSVLTTYVGTVRFSLSKTEGRPFNYQITGAPDQDLVPVLELFYEEGQIISEHAIDFGTTSVGKPIRKTFTISNTGLTRLLLSNPKVPEGFTLIDSFPEKIDAGEIATYTVELNADSAKRATGNIEFQTNISGQNLVSFPVVGIVDDIAAATPSGLPIAAVVVIFLVVGTAGSYFLIRGPVRNYRLRRSLSGKPTFQFKPKMDEGRQTIKQATPLKADFEVRLKPLLDYGKQKMKFKKMLILDEAVQTKKSESTKPDDLTRIEGIGPVISGILQKAGITTFRQLAEADVKKIQQMLHDAGITGIADPSTWPLQAELAASKEWKQLNKLQEELKGGRVVHEKV